MGEENDINWDGLRNPVMGDLKFVMSQCDSRVIRKIVSADELITSLGNELEVTSGTKRIEKRGSEDFIYKV